VLKIELEAHTDARGRFVRVFDAPVYAAAGIPVDFAQDNVSVSGPSVLRGLHFQHRHPQGKLLGVLEGTIYDVAVDLRVGSPGFGQWVGVMLDAAKPSQVWVPPGFAHGFCVVRAPAVVHYRCTTAYDPDDQHGVRWDDPDLDIDWPVEAPVISPRDALLPRLAELGPARLF
jgi:dTDP-4-dehydrorhamnose 3,5-epimerase